MVQYLNNAYPIIMVANVCCYLNFIWTSTVVMGTQDGVDVKMTACTLFSLLNLGMLAGFGLFTAFFVTFW